jgi:hypothetical protein
MAGAADKLELAHLFLWQVLPISLNGPIIFMADTAYNIKWAHLFFIAGAANKIDWAHYFYGKYCR